MRLTGLRGSFSQFYQWMISPKFLVCPRSLAFPSAPVELHNTGTVEVSLRAGHTLKYPRAQIIVPEVCITLLLGNYGFFLYE